MDEVKELDESLLFGIKLMGKDMKKNHKELSKKMKNAGEVFLCEIENIQKFTEKMERFMRKLSSAESSYQESLKTKDNFEVSLKLETRIKILSNKLSQTRHKIQITKDNILKESAKYLHETNSLFNDLLKLNEIKGESHRSYLQCYLTTLQNMWKNSHNELENFTINCWSSENFTLEEETERTSRVKKASERYSDVKEALQKFDKLIETYANLESEYIKTFAKIFENWNPSSFIGLESGFFNFLDSTKTIAETVAEFIEECEFIRKNIQNHKKTSDQISVSDITEEIITQQSQTLNESKRQFLSIILSNLSEKVKIISAAAKSFDSIDEIREIFSFSKEADFHSYQCPYYTYEINIQKESLLQSSNNEEAKWLNNLLAVFVEEWKNSEKFQKYACKKLAKKLNKDNPKFVGSISVSDFKYEGASPVIREFSSFSEGENQFFYDVWIVANGETSFKIIVPIELTYFTINFEAVVSITDFSGKIRLFYTSADEDQSWYSFVEKPIIRLLVYPKVSNNFIDVNQEFNIKYLIDKALDKKLSNYVYPKKRSVKIPKARPKRQQYP